ncbi:MAG: ribonuclease HIII [Clostridiales bacterium]|nr:ribonuclease HIII [Clostridiales bacterium]
MILVYKVSPNIKEKVIEYYKDLQRPNKPPYSVFQAEEADTIITLYESGKLMFQGKNADIDANMWFDLEYSFNKRDVRHELDIKEKEKARKQDDITNDKFKNISTIGSDEVGTGDYFGPIVVTASFVDIKKKTWLTEIGVKDSKRLTDEKIREIAPQLIKEIPHCTFILKAEDYNKNMIFNMNKVKAILHNKVLVNLLKTKYDYKVIVMDQFVYREKYYEHIKNMSEKVDKIFFTTKAESKCLSVAVSSIISRYIFLLEMDKLSKKYNREILKGAGENVDDLGAELVKEYGIEILDKIAKINFKNTDKIRIKAKI